MTRPASEVGRPYSPQTLANRWGCSAEKVRTMCRNGELASFTLGKLIRIPAHEVERYECQSTPSLDTEESLPSRGESLDDCTRAEFQLARLTNVAPKASPERFGHGSTPQRANG